MSVPKRDATGPLVPSRCSRDHNGAMRVLVVADETDRDGGYVTERLRQRGATIEVLDREHLDATTGADATERHGLLLLLGSHRSAHDPAHSHDVALESRMVRESLVGGTPVMGICFGAQVMARALGGTSYAMDVPEVGWRRVDTIDDVLCPRGPWGQFHADTFSPPPTARVLGSTWYGPQCFVDDSHGARAIGWQFHPEVTPEVYARWIDQSAAVVRAGGADPNDLKREARANAPRAKTRAFSLVDAALDYLAVPASPI